MAGHGGASEGGDQSLPPETRLLKRVPKHWITKKQDSGPRPNSGNFKRKKGESGVSVTVWHTRADLERCIAGHEEGFYLVCITAGQLYELNLHVKETPQEDNPSHADIVDGSEKLTEGKAKKLARNAEWVKPYCPADEG